MSLLNYRPYSNVTGFPASLLSESLLFKESHIQDQVNLLKNLMSFSFLSRHVDFFFFLLFNSGSNILEKVVPGNLNLPMSCFTYYTATS